MRNAGGARVSSWMARLSRLRGCPKSVTVGGCSARMAPLPSASTGARAQGAWLHRYPTASARVRRSRRTKAAAASTTTTRAGVHGLAQQVPLPPSTPLRTPPSPPRLAPGNRDQQTAAAGPHGHGHLAAGASGEHRHHLEHLEETHADAPGVAVLGPAPQESMSAALPASAATPGPFPIPGVGEVDANARPPRRLAPFLGSGGADGRGDASSRPSLLRCGRRRQAAVRAWRWTTQMDKARW